MLGFILSQPRSGSTVLTAILDKRKGIICMPESSFPQVLGVVSSAERSNPKKLASLYLSSTFAPTPLTFEDAEACMSGSNEEILMALGKSLASKLGRNRDDVKVVVWKTTRTIGMHRGPMSTNGKFIVLRRHPQNVFESQFRFDYGTRNRKPFRYAVFSQSYEHALGRCPDERTFKLDYEEIPQLLPKLVEFLGIKDQGEWDTGVSSLDLVAERCSWLTQITEEFRNTDEEKRGRLDPKMVSSLNSMLTLTRPFRPFMGPLRAHFDRRSMGHIWEFAREHYVEKD